MTETASRDDRPAGPDRVLVVTGVPRSGTTVLNALLCTSPQTNPLIGEASYLRLMLRPYSAAAGLFDEHTRYAFGSPAELRDFHRRIMAELVEVYWTASGCPRVLVLKDPLLTPQLQLLHDLIPQAETILILRHPVDVIGSRLAVQDRLGVPRDPERVMHEHDFMLNAVLSGWSTHAPRVVTYPQLGHADLAAIRRASGLDDLDPARLWTRSLKPREDTTVWQTPLSGGPIRADRRPVDLTAEEIEAIEATCLPLCLQLLERAGMTPGPYWSLTAPQQGARTPPQGRRAGNGGTGSSWARTREDDV